ncbi:MAG: hypothetical protein H6834_01030 [Planctomycetes bacterium]|nr:hypothetical protein [Planctomycetota bacterium]
MDFLNRTLEPRPSRVRAAAKLLLDPDPKIHRACARQLVLWGESARSALVELIEVEDASARIRVRRLLQQLERERWLSRWIEFARTEVDLEDGMLLFCELQRPLGEIADVRSTFDEWALELAPRIDGLGTRRIVDELSAFFHGDLSFRGNRRSYDDPDNSSLDSVVRRRLGTPISLCAVWMLVGRRLGLPLEGVGLPGHFILRLRAARSVLIDPFHGGRILTRRDCIDRIQAMGYAYENSLLEPADDRRMLLRCLGNLAHGHGDREVREVLNRARTALVSG